MAREDGGLDMGKMALQGFGQMMDTMESVKRAWSTFDLPTPFAPTLNLADLDKRIADLRAIEQWLTLNQNMLRGTIQGLEIQRGTLNAVRNLSESIGKAVQPADAAMAQSVAQLAADAARDATARAPSADAAAGGHPQPFGPAAVMSLFGPLGAFQPFGPFGTAPAASSPASPAGSPPAPHHAPHHAPQPAPQPPSQPADPASSAARGDASGIAGSMSPLAWWDLLQKNFQHLAEAAVSQGGGALSSTTSTTSASAGAPATPARAPAAAGTKPAPADPATLRSRRQSAAPSATPSPAPSTAPKNERSAARPAARTRTTAQEPARPARRKGSAS